MKSEVVRRDIIIDWKNVATSVLKKWWLIALCFVLGAGAGLGLGIMADRPVYRCEATYVLSYSGGDSVGDMASEYSFLSRILFNCVEIVKQNTFTELIAQDVNAGVAPTSPEYIDPEDLGACIGYEYATQGTLIYVTVDTGDPALSYRITHAVTSHLSDYIISHYGLAGGNSMVFSLINTPEPPEEPVESSVRFTFTLLGAAAFALLCVVVVALVALLDTRIKKEDDLKNKYNVPVLGTIPNFFDPALSKGGYYRYVSYEK